MKDIKVKWLLERDTFDEENLNEIIGALDKRKLEHKVIRYRPFTTEIKKYYKDNECVMVYGSINLVKQVQRTSWIPGSFCNFQAFKCSTYYSYLGKYLLNQTFVITPLAELVRRVDFFFNRFAIDGCIFVRPNNSDKEFNGQVIDIDDFPEKTELIQHFNSPSTLVVVAEPRIIEEEFRFFARNDGTIITGSKYQEKNKSVREDFDNDALEFAKKIAKEKFRPDPIYSIDVCRTPEGLYLLELGGFSCAGFYTCNIDTLIVAANEEAAKEYHEYFGGYHD